MLGSTRRSGHPCNYWNAQVPLPLDPHDAPAHDQSVIVGRSWLLMSLDSTLEAAEAGRHACVLLVGEPGMGTTTILASVCDTARDRGWVVAQAGAAEGGAQMSLALVHDVLHALLSALDRLGGQHEALDVLLAPDRQQIGPVAESLRDLVADASLDRPVLLAMDDLQWADDDSLAIIALAAGRLSGTRTVVVGAGHPSAGEDVRLLGWQRYDVSPLDEGDAMLLLDQVLGTPADDDQARRVVRALGRCPLAIVECRRLLSHGQLTGSQPLPDPIPISPRLRHAWAGLAARLPDASRRALLALAALDTSQPELVREVLVRAGCSEDDLVPAWHAGLVRSGLHGAPVVVGPLARAAVLRLHPATEVRAMHRCVADTAASAGSPPTVVIEHLRRACEYGDAGCVADLESQACRAEARCQPDVAAQGWLAAARISPTPAARAARAVRAARVWLMESACPEGGAELLDLLQQVPLAPADTVWREWLRAEVMATQNLARSAASALVAARHATVAQPALAPWLLWDAAATAWMAGDPQLALEAARELDAVASSAASASRTLVPSWLGPTVLGAALLQAGSTAQGADLFATARAVAGGWASTTTTETSELLNVVALDELLVLDLPITEQRLQELSARLSDEHGATTAAVLVIEATRARRRGDWASAIATAADAATLAAAVRAGTAERAALCLMVELGWRAGDCQPAVLQRLLDSATLVGDRHALLVADRELALQALAQGRPDVAAQRLDQLAHSPLWGRTTTDPALAGRVDLVEADVRCGAHASARLLLDSLAPHLAALQAVDPDARALLRRAQALVATPAAAGALFEDAILAHQNGHDGFEAARTHLLHAEHLRRVRRGDAARREEDIAAGMFARLGASAWVRPCPEQEALFDSLTAQERRVAELVATGATNNQVAATLCLSTRTVESHLAAVYRKLGLRGRTQLAHVASASARISDARRWNP
jgi:DNA-binding NarL/FixJ family response regulator